VGSRLLDKTFYERAIFTNVGATTPCP
jgi:hypothetical protein